MSQTYHILMEDGSKHDVRADSAGEAIYAALHRNRGVRVATCFAGGYAQSQEDLVPDDNAGRITFEVPKHKAMDLEPGAGRHTLCAGYVRKDDHIVLETNAAWHVRAVASTPAQVLFTVSDVRDVNNRTELRYHKNTLLAIVRPDAPS